jgi:N-methylhydantoinase B
MRANAPLIDRKAVFLGHLDRCKIPPWGLGGGEPGGVGRIVLNPGTTRERALPSKVWGHVLAPGDVVSVETPGGGGYGPASERPAEFVDTDR